MKRSTSKIVVVLVSAAFVYAVAKDAACFTIDMDTVGVIRIAATKKIVGTAFIARKQKQLVTYAHVVSGDEGYVYHSAGKRAMKVDLTLRYAMPRYDLAVFSAQLEKDVTSLSYGDMKRVRPGDKIFYIGWSASMQSLIVRAARVSATGSVLHEGAIVDFLEFEGKGVPGYSGGPVFDSKGGVIAILREGWTKRGLKGGETILVNRAFSVKILSELDQEVMTSAPSGASVSQYSLLEVALPKPIKEPQP